MKSKRRDVVLAELRAHIERIAPPRTIPGRIPTGIEVLDEILGGWPCPGISLIEGRPGLGRLGLVLPVLRDLTHEGRWVPIVDGADWLHPPGLDGVDLSRLILIRPGSRVGWTATQLIRSGGFPLVVVLDPPRLKQDGRRLQHAAEQGKSALILISESRESGIPLSARITMLPGGKFCVRKGARRGGSPVAHW